MATLLDLVRSEALFKLDVGLSWREQEERQILTYPKAMEWMNGRLPNEVSAHGIDTSPHEQLGVFAYEFCAGREIIFDRQIHPMHHIDAGIWELKTQDVRLFGWFAVKDSFICTNGDTMERTKKHNLYAGYRDEAVRLRDLLDLDGRKFIPGDNPHDVVSACYFP